MILALQGLVHDAIVGIIQRQYGLADVPPFVVEVPPTRVLGDLSVAVAFQLARPLRKAPRAIAEDIAAGIGPLPGVARIVVAANGYLNLFLERSTFLQSRLRGEVQAPPTSADKTIVEHTAINPNKAAHIGHLRNAALGDTLARVLLFRGAAVEVQNYIDDLGVQVADIVVGFRELEKRSLDQVREIADTTRFDYLCWDLYAKVTDWYEQDRDRLSVRAAALHDLEQGGNDTAAVATLIVERVVRAHLNTMARLGIAYDLLTYEGDILRLQFWARAFEILKASGAVFLQTEGRLTGCWVMRIDQDAGAVIDDDVEEPEAREKVIVRSNGVVTYVGKDIANQLWKFGLLGKDFYYKPLTRYTDGHQVWVSTDEPQTHPAPAFGKAETVYNVIDVRQSYLQDVVVAGLKALGFDKQAENSIHFSYEMVALSPRCCADLGIELSPEDAKKPYIEVSGRKGLGVKADDLMDKLIETALVEVSSRHPEDSVVAQRAIATEIAMGALRYFLLKFTRTTVIAFDFQEALSFEGETGPYVQYAAVRARNIFRKLEDRGETKPNFAKELSAEALARQLASEELWQYLLAASRSDSAVNRAITAGEPAHVAKYAFQLAQTFNNFYHQYPVLAEPDRERKVFLLWMTDFFREQLERTLAILGIATPAYM
jgi:arginyl-tRNA synthetase